MNSVIWIIVAVVAVIVVLALLVLLGLRRGKARQISFEKEAELEQKKPTSGDYQAKGGFNFSSGTAAGLVEEVRAPEVVNDPVVPPVGRPVDVPEAGKTGGTVAEVPDAPDAPDAPVESDVPAESVEPVESEQDTAEVSPQPGQSAESVETEQPASREEPEEPEVSAEPEAPAAPGQSEAPAEPEESAAPVAAHEGDQIEHIAPVEGRLGRLRGSLSRSQNVIGRGVLGILSAGDLDEDAWEEIEDTLIMADLGTRTTVSVVEKLRDRIAAGGVQSEEQARAMLRECLIEACHPEFDRSIHAVPYDGKPAVIMVVGVNGTGKTTTTGKLSRVLVGMGHSVLLGAADTFRAAAADQLETWGRRVGAQTVRGREGADPASVAFDAVARGVEEGVDVVVVDTAGRLHTSVGLMDQLGKVKRVIEKKAKVDEVILVLDATVGQNGLTQARTFRDVVDISGVALTKLDGSAKGGIVFQVQEELGVPVKLVGLGEGADDLAPFEVESFVDALLG